MKRTSVFTRLSRWTGHAAGRPATFGLAVLVVLVWGISGPFFGFGDTWQLVINTGTTIITFLMVFLIQSTQNTDTEAMQLKLDELIRVIDGAQNALLDLEEMEEKHLNAVRDRYRRLASQARENLDPADFEDEGEVRSAA